jgi:hypothetical protein
MGSQMVWNFLYPSCLRLMMTYQHQLNVMIAETLEKVQHLNPDLYATWYSKLYPPHGNGDYWNVQTLHTLEQLLIDYAN